MTNAVKTVTNLVDKGLIKESVLMSFVNDQLSSLGLSLSDKPVRAKVKATKAEAESAPRGVRKVKAKTEKRSEKRSERRTERKARVSGDYKDGRTNMHAILLAIDSFGDKGCDSASLREKLKEIGHEMETAVLHTTRSIMQSKRRFIKSTGGPRQQVYRLTVQGKAELEEYEAAPAIDAAAE